MFAISKYTPFTTLSRVTGYFCKGEFEYSLWFIGQERHDEMAVAADMQQYFEKIKQSYGNSFYDQLFSHFASSSSLFVDSLKVNEFHVYGSSRLGIYESNTTIAWRNAYDANNDNQLSESEYNVGNANNTAFLFANLSGYRGKIKYEMSNHLGNVLTVVSDKKQSICSNGTFVSYTAEVISATDYSPFGAPLPGRTFAGEGYRFGFNGKEVDNETYGDGNAYDFGARIYDARLGRWLSLDPLQQEYPFISPYNFTLNSPITSVDPDGKRVIVTRIPGEGKDGRDLVLIKVDAKWVDKTSRILALETQKKKVGEIQNQESGRYQRAQRKLNNMQIAYDAYVGRELEEIKSSIESTFSGMDDKTEFKTEVTISNGTSGNVNSDDHVFFAVDEVVGATARASDIGGLALYYSPDNASFSTKKTKAHEYGHLLGLLHNSDNLFEGKPLNQYSGEQKYNFIKQFSLEQNVMDYSEIGKEIHNLQLNKIESNFNQGKLNKGNNNYNSDHGSTNKESTKGYEIDYKKD